VEPALVELIDYDLALLVGRARDLADRPGRTLLGIAGPPGAGKSTLADRLAAALGRRTATVVLDGFHLADAELARLGRADRKGAPDTFDRAGFVAALRRLRAADDVVYLPRFHRELEAAVAGEIAVDPDVALLLVEGNYLLHWPQVHAQLDQTWYLDPPDADRVATLIARHVAFGRSPAAAREWVLRSDEANAALVANGRERADVVVRARSWPPTS
jgi:pantothenate kinase